MPKLFGSPSSRAIWPSIARSVPLARCTLEAQLLFERLISQADDQGRLQGEPVLVAAACVPLVRKATPKAVERWIEELVENDLILWYQAGPGKQWLIQLCNWWDHQSGQRWIYPSRWPAPRDWEDREPKTPRPIEEVMAPASRRKDSGNAPESRRNGAGVTPDVGVGGGGGGGSGEDRRSSTPKPPPSRVPRDGVVLADQTRPDLVALRERGMTYIRRSELEILDHIADNERAGEWQPISTGQEVIAGWIRSAPAGVHLVDHVLHTENELKRQRGADADAADEEWNRQKESDRRAAPEQLGSIVARLVPGQEAQGG
jgi:hypothetical protein